VTHTRDWEIQSVTRTLLDNLGELAQMILLPMKIIYTLCMKWSGVLQEILKGEGHSKKHNFL